MFRSIRKFTLLKQIVVITICASLFSCAGRQANPVPMNMPGDNSLSKDGLRLMMSQVQSQVDLKAPNADKGGKNAALGVAGLFLIFPWFFMDFSEADMIELNALRDRYNYLAILYNEKELPQNKLMEMPTYQQLAENEELREKFSKQIKAMDATTKTTPLASSISATNTTPSKAGTQSNYCGSCGKSIRSKSKIHFCPNCGEEIN